MVPVRVLPPVAGLPETGGRVSRPDVRGVRFRRRAGGRGGALGVEAAGAPPSRLSFPLRQPPFRGRRSRCRQSKSVLFYFFFSLFHDVRVGENQWAGNDNRWSCESSVFIFTCKDLEELLSNSSHLIDPTALLASGVNSFPGIEI